MKEILEIDNSAIYKIGSLELQGDELKHHLANGLRYEEIKEQFHKESVTQ